MELLTAVANWALQYLAPMILTGCGLAALALAWYLLRAWLSWRQRVLQALRQQGFRPLDEYLRRGQRRFGRVGSLPGRRPVWSDWDPWTGYLVERPDVSTGIVLYARGAEPRRGLRVVLLTGPSASGKSTIACEVGRRLRSTPAQPPISPMARVIDDEDVAPQSTVARSWGSRAWWRVLDRLAAWSGPQVSIAQFSDIGDPDALRMALTSYVRYCRCSRLLGLWPPWRPAIILDNVHHAWAVLEDTLTALQDLSLLVILAARPVSEARHSARGFVQQRFYDAMAPAGAGDGDWPRWELSDGGYDGLAQTIVGRAAAARGVVVPPDLVARIVTSCRPDLLRLAVMARAAGDILETGRRPALAELQDAVLHDARRRLEEIDADPLVESDDRPKHEPVVVCALVYGRHEVPVPEEFLHKLGYSRKWLDSLVDAGELVRSTVAGRRWYGLWHGSWAELICDLVTAEDGRGALDLPPGLHERIDLKAYNEEPVTAALRCAYVDWVRGKANGGETGARDWLVRAAGGEVPAAVWGAGPGRWLPSMLSRFGDSPLLEQLAALRLLGWAGTHQALPFLMAIGAEPLSADAGKRASQLSNDGLQRRWAAAAAIRGLGDEAVEACLSAMASLDKDPGLFVDFMCDAFPSPHDRGIQACRQALADEGPLARRLAAIGLGMSGTPEAFGLLVKALGDPDFRACGGAITGLGALGDPAAASHLESFVDHPKVGIRRVTAMALGGLSSPAAVPPLSRLAEDGNEEVRFWAVRGLGRSRSVKGVSPLVKRLRTDEKARIRREAAKALGVLGHNLAEGPLLAALQDEDDVAREAALSLGQLRTPAALVAVAAWKRPGNITSTDGG